MIPEGLGKPGHLYTVSYGKTGQLGTYKLETQMTSGNGKFERTGINSDAGAREAMDSAYRYLRANYGSVSQSISLTTKICRSCSRYEWHWYDKHYRYQL